MEIFSVILILILLVEVTLLLLKTGRSSDNAIYRAHRKILVDTSVLMDGRILNVARTGFLTDDLIIPKSVIRELQLLADSSTGEKRTRARQGMSLVNELERVEFFNTTIYADELDHAQVDERLIELAHKLNASIMTNDFTLNKVAKTEKIEVLNLNDLTIVLQDDYDRGDRFELEITGVGSNKRQGIGHLPSGVMVAVAKASDKVGQTVTVEVERYWHSPSGRMIFAKMVPNKPTKKAKNKTAKD